MARILIADDRKSIRMEVRASFRMHTDWHVCGEAEDGREAMAKAAELRPDLIVMDFQMPLADGLKAASEIGMSMPNVPIVMYTLSKTRELEVAPARKQSLLRISPTATCRWAPNDLGIRVLRQLAADFEHIQLASTRRQV